MFFKYVFRELTPSHSLAQYTESKVGNFIHKLTRGFANARVVFCKEGILKQAKCQFYGSHGFECFVEASSDDFYSAVDKMADKLKVCLRKKKEKIHSR